jgi:hypothetical protein
MTKLQQGNKIVIKMLNKHENPSEGGGGGRVFHSKTTGIFPKITCSLLQYYLKGN